MGRTHRFSDHRSQGRAATAPGRRCRAAEGQAGQGVAAAGSPTREGLSFLGRRGSTAAPCSGDCPHGPGLMWSPGTSASPTAALGRLETRTQLENDSHSSALLSVLLPGSCDPPGQVPGPTHLCTAGQAARPPCLCTPGREPCWDQPGTPGFPMAESTGHERPGPRGAVGAAHSRGPLRCAQQHCSQQPRGETAQVCVIR